MTQNQINYQRHLEDVRTHKANEEIAARQAAASEKQASVAESKLQYDALNAESNRMSASAGQTSAAAAMYGAQANAAYQSAMSAVSRFSAEENARHNAQSELLSELQQIQQRDIEHYKADKSAETAVTTALIGASSKELVQGMQNKNATANTLISTLGNVAGKLITNR